MNEFFSRIIQQFSSLWGRWTLLQKSILFGVFGVGIIAIIFLFSFSSTPEKVALIGTPITQQENLERIVVKLDEEGISYEINSENLIFVEDQVTARRMRAILIREDLLPPKVDPFSLFDVDRFSITDFERNVNLQRAITAKLEQHIEALDDVDVANVTLVVPARELFVEDQNPTTASIIITPAIGSDITENRQKIEGIQRLVEFAVAGLLPKHIVITDHNSLQINNFDNFTNMDRLTLAERQMQTKFNFEHKYKREILSALGAIYTSDRVQVIKLDIDLDLSVETTEIEEHFPVTMREDNPATPFDETTNIESITISKEIQEESFRGTGFNPEGPPGQEGQLPPAYQDLSNLTGQYERSAIVQNEAVNRRNTFSEKSPWSINRITVSVAIDGVWETIFQPSGREAQNEDGSIKRQYTEISVEELRKAQALISDAIGSNLDRGDSVTVEHLKFDRTQQFLMEDENYRRELQLRSALFSLIVVLAVVIVGLFLYRIISRRIEQQRRLREEELARQHQEMREEALRNAEEVAEEGELSIEERQRLEMQESLTGLAREKPENVAQLIRMWLVEE